MNNRWTIARRNLIRNKRRNLATGVAIAFGFAALLTVGGYYNWTSNLLRVFTVYISRIGHIVIYKENGLEKYLMKPKKFSLDESDQAAIHDVVSRMNNVEMSGGQLIGTGLVGNGCRSFPFIASGIDHNLVKALTYHPESENWIGDLKNYRKGRDPSGYPDELGAISVSEGLAKLLSKTKVYDDVKHDEKGFVVIDCMAKNAQEKIASDANVQLAAGAWTGMMSSIDGEIVAQYLTGLIEIEYTHITISLARLQKLYDTPNITSYSIWLRDPSKILSTIQGMKSHFTRLGKHFDIYKWDDEFVSPYYTGTHQFVITLCSFVTIVLLCVIVFSIFNSVTITTIERSQEIGMMRSLGYTKTQIRMLFIMENLLLTAISLVIGGIIGALGIYIVDTWKIPYNPPGIAVQLWLRLSPSIPVIAASIILLFVLSTLTTLAAVWTVTKQNIAGLLIRVHR
ncbi:MAG: FtsX-like permease family protein [Oligoflexales bacterium]|nr:FtsX-like permease family protein [Oligoflexales bacterium]